MNMENIRIGHRVFSTAKGKLVGEIKSGLPGNHKDKNKRA